MMAYNAFISYSRSADVTLAAALQSALHSFTKPWYKLRALHIFRDQTNLAVNPALWSSIREAIDQSLFFILLASPEAAASPWVAKEAEYWIGRNGTARVLIVLTGGTLKWDHLAASFTAEPSNALPPGLLHAFPEEPLFLDLRWARDGSASTCANRAFTKPCSNSLLRCTIGPKTNSTGQILRTGAEPAGWLLRSLSAFF
jgi:TIR domain